MPRSHPPALLRSTERTLRERCGVGPGDRILVAVSGGPDSMALLDVLAKLAPKLGFFLSAHGVDHGLRAEAPGELELARAHAERLGVAFATTRVELSSGGNLQARARAARYAALDAALSQAGAKWLATAHHADDRAETVLLRLLRGSGPRGLAVLPARWRNRIRPFLEARRRDIELHLERHRVPFADDPSNRDRRYLRVRVREELIPLLVELSPGIVGHLTALSEALGDIGGELEVEPRVPFPLGRAQRRELYRAQRERSPRARVWLSGGIELSVDPESGQPVALPQTRPARDARNKGSDFRTSRRGRTRG